MPSLLCKVGQSEIFEILVCNIRYQGIEQWKLRVTGIIKKQICFTVLQYSTGEGECRRYGGLMNDFRNIVSINKRVCYTLLN